MPTPKNIKEITIKESSFLHLIDKSRKTFTIHWTDELNRPFDIKRVKVFKTDKDYKNLIQITTPEITPNLLASQNQFGFDFEYEAPNETRPELFYQIEYDVDGTGNDILTIRIHSFFKPNGNPGTQGDVMKRVP